MLAQQLAQAQRAWFSDNGKVNAFGPPSSNISQRAHLYDPIWITPRDVLAGWLEAPNNLHSVAQHTSHAITLRLMGMVGRTFPSDEQRYLGGPSAVGSSLFQDKRLQLADLGAGVLCGPLVPPFRAYDLPLHLVVAIFVVGFVCSMSLPGRCRETHCM